MPADDDGRARTRVTSPLTSAPAHVRRSVRQEIDESTGIGEVYMRSLVRSQLRAALAVTTVLVLTIGSLPLVFIAFDGLATTRLWGVPLPWLVLGVAVYPGVLLVGWLYVRRAERAEADFADLVDAQERDR